MVFSIEPHLSTRIMGVRGGSGAVTRTDARYSYLGKEWSTCDAFATPRWKCSEKHFISCATQRGRPRSGKRSFPERGRPRRRSSTYLYIAVGKDGLGPSRKAKAFSAGPPRAVCGCFRGNTRHTRNRHSDQETSVQTSASRSTEMSEP
jgi:hypothetical protein